MEPSRLLTSSENIFRRRGARNSAVKSVVGDICCYFDAQGEPVKSALMQRVIGIEFSSLERVWSAAEALLARRRTSRLIDPTAPANAAPCQTALHKAVASRNMKGGGEAMDQLEMYIAESVLGIDTLWGGDVMCPSGAGRFIADSWFSDEPLPSAYTYPAAAQLRRSGGVSAKTIDREAVEAYLRQVDLPRALAGLRKEAAHTKALRRAYLTNLALCLETMWDLAMEVLGKGDPVPYARAVEASTGKPPEPSRPEARRDRVAKLLGRAGHKASDLPAAVDGWRRDRLVPMASVRAIGAAAIAHFNALSADNLVPYLPQELACVPRANIDFLPIRDAWFSGSMNYIGRARTASGSPQYEASYEINASLEISYPEFEQLVSHEVVPGHVTTFAYLQNQFVRGAAGFEATILTMNTRAATLFEGLANNAILIAHGVTEIEELPDEDLQIGVLLALLQDDAKNQSSYMSWGEGRSRQEVAAVLRRDFLVTEERADKLSGAWGRHPLLGRMYLPAYRAGTEKIAQLRRAHAAEQVLPAIYGCHGPVDIQSVDLILEGMNRH